MNSINKTRSAFYPPLPRDHHHDCFVFLTPAVVHQGYHPRWARCWPLSSPPYLFLYLHLRSARRRENRTGILQLNLFTTDYPDGNWLPMLPDWSLSFAIWTATEPLNRLITEKFLGFLPDWFTVQDFAGYSKTVILQTLFVNLLVNGVLAPLVEEYYFRGYLLARMQTWGRSALSRQWYSFFRCITSGNHSRSDSR